MRAKLPQIIMILILIAVGILQFYDFPPVVNILFGLIALGVIIVEIILAKKSMR